MQFLGLIPARGGSKRIKRKNIIKLGGRPLIGHTILAAKNCRELNKILVSTDDYQINKVAVEYGVEAHERPQYLATDHADAISLIQYYFELHNHIENIVYLQPTSPFRTAVTLSAAIRDFKMSECDVLVSICRTPHALSSEKQFKIKDDGFVLSPQVNPPRAQEIGPSYHRNGPAILITNRSILKRKDIYDARVYTFLMNKVESLDIDDQEDLFIARGVQQLKEKTNEYMHSDNKL